MCLSMVSTIGTICDVYKIVLLQSLMVGTGWRCEWATLAPVLGVGQGTRGTSGQGLDLYKDTSKDMS